MSDRIFKRETALFERASAFLEVDDRLTASQRAEFESLLRGYEKLMRASRRLMKLSDRNEEQLNALAHTLDEKNRMLEGLSEKLGKYLSRQVFDSIFSGETAVELSTRRKKLTVFFSDIKDFTVTTEDLQPEDLTYLLNSYFSEMSAIAVKHGATIDKFIGDAMLMFFGDPDTRGVVADARACVAMAMEMQERMRALQARWDAKGYDRPFRMRIGIHTGFCNVGNFGSKDRMDYTIVGGEVNLAARLEAAADPDGILLSHETHALVRDMVSAEERPEVPCKGIRKSVRAFAVQGRRDDTRCRAAVSADLPGMTMLLDPADMDAEARRQARAKLEEALSLIQRAG